MATDWFVRPYKNALYGTGSGLSYTNAWDGPTSIVWGGSGVVEGDTVWVCDIFGSSGPTSDSIGHARMAVGTSSITVRGDYPDHPCTWFNVSMRDSAGHTWVDTGTNNVYVNNEWSGSVLALWYSPDNITFTQMARDPKYSGAGAPSAAVLATFVNGDWGKDTTSRYIYVKIPDNSPTTYYWIGTYSSVGYGSITANGKSYINVQSIDFKGSGLEFTNTNNVNLISLNFVENWRSVQLLGGGNNYYNLTNCNFNRTGAAIYTTYVSGPSPSYIIVDDCHSTELNVAGTPKSQGEPDYQCYTFQGGTNLVVRNSSVDGAANGVFHYVETIYGATDCLVDSCYGSNMRVVGAFKTYGSAFECSGPSAADVTFTVRNSIATNCQKAGLRYEVGGSTGNKIFNLYNNTVYKCNYGIELNCLSSTADPVVIWKNNLISTLWDSGNGFALDYIRSTIGLPHIVNHNITSNNNCFDGVVTSGFYYSDGHTESGTVSLSGWQALTLETGNPDANSIAANPQFINAGGSYALDTDFIPDFGSPVIGAGVAVSGVTTDYAGHGYRNPPSIGSYEITESYTREAALSLPADDTDLSTPYSASDYTAVATDNGVRVAQSATDQYAIHEFKNNATGKKSVNLTWDGQTNIPCSTSTVYLQIYNYTSNEWDTVDSDNTTGANTDFTLAATVSLLTNYKDTDEFIACRVYQKAQ